MSTALDITINLRIPRTPELDTANPAELLRHLESVCRVAVKQVANAKADVCAEEVRSGCECCDCPTTPQGATSCKECQGAPCHECKRWAHLCEDGCGGTQHGDGRGYDCESFCSADCAEDYFQRMSREKYQAELAARGEYDTPAVVDSSDLELPI